MPDQALKVNPLEQCRIFDGEADDRRRRGVAALAIIRDDSTESLWVGRREAWNIAQHEDGPRIQRLMIAIDALKAEADRLSGETGAAQRITELENAKRSTEHKPEELKSRQPHQPHAAPRE